jgi:hypothetical protein
LLPGRNLAIGQNVTGITACRSRRGYKDIRQSVRGRSPDFEPNPVRRN